MRNVPDRDHATTPEARWRAAVATAPLESAQPITGRWAPVARAMTGRADTRYTSGPATRGALQAAGALGATTGTVIHLSRPPSDRAEDAAVIRHELAHSRTPVRRPRFLLAGGSGHDEEERSAQRAAHLVQHAPTLGSVQSGAAQPGSVPRSAIQTSPLETVQRALARGTATVDTDVLSRYPAGLVDTLPVTGIGGLMEAARTASGPYAGAGYGGGVTAASLAAATGLPPALPPALSNAPAGWTQAGGSVYSGSPGGADAGAALTGTASAGSPHGGGLPAGGSPAGGGPGGSGTPAAGGSGPVAGAASAAAAGPGAMNAPGGVPDLDRLLEALEDNVLRELERRGGRYEGMF